MHKSLSYLRCFFACLVVIALGMRSLIPVGYMPDFSGHGKGIFPMILCDGFEHMSHDEHAEHLHHHHGGGQHHEGACPFAASAIVSFNQPGAAVYGHFLYNEVSQPPFFSQRPGKQPDFHNASPRSPPIFS